MIKSLLVCAWLLLIAPPTFAHSYKQGAIMIGHIWARATAPGAHAASVYVPLLNQGGEADALTGGSTEIAATVMLHEVTQQDGVSRMTMINTVPLPPKQPVALRPGGKHIMLTGLKRQLKEGEKFTMTLQFAKAGMAEVEVWVHAPGAKGSDH